MTGAEYTVLRDCATANANNQAYAAPVELVYAAMLLGDDGCLTCGLAGYWITAAGKRELARIERLVRSTVEG